MHMKLQEYLHQKHRSVLFGKQDPNEAPLYFECGDGWFHLLDQLFSCLAFEVEWKVKGNPRKFAHLNNFQVTEVKEKYGTLRVYVVNSDPSLDAHIHMCGEFSRRICELCGAPGSALIWHQCRCRDCFLQSDPNSARLAAVPDTMLELCNVNQGTKQ